MPFHRNTTFRCDNHVKIKEPERRQSVDITNIMAEHDKQLAELKQIHEGMRATYDEQIKALEESHEQSVTDLESKDTEKDEITKQLADKLKELEKLEKTIIEKQEMKFEQPKKKQYMKTPMKGQLTKQQVPTSGSNKDLPRWK
jgi:hypothetical protein